jgi:hypothetical protein
MQALLRPRPLELLKRLMLGGAFLLWGVVQLMPISELANELGNVVIAMYVVDLALMIRPDLQRASRGRIRHPPPRAHPRRARPLPQPSGRGD